MLPTRMLAVRNPANRRTGFKTARRTGQSYIRIDGNVRIVRDDIPKGRRRPGRPKKQWSDTFYSRNTEKGEKKKNISFFLVYSLCCFVFSFPEIPCLISYRFVFPKISLLLFHLPSMFCLFSCCSLYAGRLVPTHIILSITLYCLLRVKAELCLSRQ
jgi:hypothetical protein